MATPPTAVALPDPSAKNARTTPLVTKRENSNSSQYAPFVPPAPPSEADDDDDDDDDDDSSSNKCCCLRCLKSAWYSFAPGGTPIFILFVFAMVLLFLLFRNVSSADDTRPIAYCVYLGFIAGQLLLWLILRLLWLRLIIRYFCLEGRIAATIITVLDPHFTYFLWSLSTFLTFAFIFASPISGDTDDAINCLTLWQYRFCINDTERSILRNVEVLAILWTLRVRPSQMQTVLRFHCIFRFGYSL